MNQRYIIGVDIGGTNTDAVIVDKEKAIVAAVKTATTADITTGFKTALQSVLREIPVENMEAIHVGTTHAINAMLERRHLYKVGVVRLAGHHPNMLPPCCGWPDDLRASVLAGHVTIDGGYECDGRAITPFCRQQVKKGIQALIDRGAESLAIVGVFSPLCPEQENEVAACIDAKIPLSLSCQLGGMGIVERENTAILNAALQKVMRQGFNDLQAAAQEVGLTCPLFITQNNGSLIDIETAMEKPVLTLSAGPTNSFIGAARLAGLSDAIVVDIGGTSTDIGVVLKGFPRRSVGATDLSGVMLNFPMPDVISIALGGGSHIDFAPEVRIGPESVGHALKTKARTFGGDQLTFTDLSIKLGLVDIPSGDKQKVGVTHEQAEMGMKTALQRITDQVAVMQADKPHLPVLLVGGGASLLPKNIMEGRGYLPKHADVANAYGAALAQISGTVDVVVSLEQRESAIESVCSQAVAKAIEAGAKEDTVQLVDLQIIPYHYVPGKQARVIAMAAGEIR